MKSRPAIYLSLIFLVLCSIFVLAAEFTPQGNINLRSIYSVLNAVDINLTNKICNATACFKLSDLNATGSAAGDITSVAAVAPYILGGGTSGAVSIDFNETVLNATIDARSASASDTRWDISTSKYLMNESDILDVNGSILNTTITALDTNDTAQVINLNSSAADQQTAIDNLNSSLVANCSGIGSCTNIAYNNTVVVFTTVDTGQGANELYGMDQAVQTTDAVTFLTVDTGQGAGELYAMDQDVQTTDAVAFSTINLTSNLAINITSGNMTDVDCIIFVSGGKICTG